MTTNVSYPVEKPELEWSRCFGVNPYRISLTCSSITVTTTTETRSRNCWTRAIRYEEMVLGNKWVTKIALKKQIG